MGSVLLYREVHIIMYYHDGSRIIFCDRGCIKVQKGSVSMPKGEPNSQTRASAKWNKAAGYIAKSYKLKKELTDAFAEACEAAGVSQASQVSKMMREFIDQQKMS